MSNANKCGSYVFIANIEHIHYIDSAITRNHVIAYWETIFAVNKIAKT